MRRSDAARRQQRETSRGHNQARENCCVAGPPAPFDAVSGAFPPNSLPIGTLGNVPETIRNDTVSVVHHPLARRVHQVRESAYRASRTFRQGDQR